MSEGQVSTQVPSASDASAARPPHHRVVSDTTITEEHPQNIQRDIASLSYGQPASAFTLDGKFTDMEDKIRRDASPEQEKYSAGQTVTQTTILDKIKWKYDLWYYRFKTHWPWVVAFLLASIVCCSIAVGWSFRLKTFNIADPGSDADAAIVQLAANIVDVDPSEQVVIVDWGIIYDCEQIGCPDANLYFDANTLRSDSTSTQRNTKPDPIFTIVGQNVRAMNNNSDRRPSSLTFRTNVAISNANTHRSLQSYPYDKYNTQLVFFAEDTVTNDTISIAIVKTTGIAVGFNVQLQNTTDISDDFGTVIKSIEITRGAVVRLYAIFIVLVVWLVTLTFMATCVMNVFFGKGISSGVLVLPMGTLFAFTQLRSTLPGAPVGFGAVIDFVGLLPCLAILTFCSIFMTAIFLLRDPEHDIPRWHWTQPDEGRRTMVYNKELRKAHSTV